MVGCSNDDVDDRRQTVKVELAPYAKGYGEVEQVMTRAATQPAWAPEGFYLYPSLTGVGGILTSNENAAICVYFTKDNETPERRKFSYTSTKWVIDKEVTAGDYQLYGFVPYSAADVTTTTIEPYGGSFANGAKLTLKGLNSVMSQDVCVVVGARHGTKEGNNDPVPVPTLRAGNFDCHFSASADVNAPSNYVFMLFDHLYAALRFQFRVHATYDALRTIKLRKLELLAYSDEECTTLMTKKVMTKVIVQKNNDGSLPIVNTISFEPDPDCDDEMEPVKVYDSEVWLRSDTWTDNIGFVPKSSSYYLLRSTYDVYDKNGNLIRYNCTADNKIDPRRKFGKESLDIGYLYTLKFIVQPTYLYVLSEPDLDNPTVVVD